MTDSMDRSTAEKECSCPLCPTYVKCGEPLAFCLSEIGKSRCITSEKGCLCPDCPVQVSERFNHDYYCIYGDELAQSQNK